MTALALHAQRSVDAERGKLVGTHRPILAHARRPDDPAVGGASVLLESWTDGRRLTLRRVVGDTPPVASRQLGRSLGIGHIFFSNDDLLEVVTFDRAGAYVGSRPRFLNTPDHLVRQDTDPSKTHPRALPSAVRYGPTVARGDKHELPENRASGTSNER